MKKKYKIEFQEAKEPITELVTKFGGQPVWGEKPEWAVSKATGKPMMFIAQIALEKEIFGEIESKMAYIFMTDDTVEYVEGTWDPNSGENAVVIQPNGNNSTSIQIETGPTLSVWKEVEGESRRKPFTFDFTVIKSEIVVDEEKMFNETFVENNETESNFEDKFKGFSRSLFFDENKIKIRNSEFSYIANELNESKKSEEKEPNFENKVGGIPNFLQNEEYPDNNKDKWNLLLQLDSSNLPFYLEFGDLGVGYAFISKDGKIGKFLWQCS